MPLTDDELAARHETLAYLTRAALTDAGHPDIAERVRLSRFHGDGPMRRVAHQLTRDVRYGGPEDRTFARANALAHQEHDRAAHVYEHGDALVVCCPTCAVDDPYTAELWACQEHR